MTAEASLYSQKDPKSCLLKYYEDINNKDFKGAYSCKSDRAKSEMSFDSWKKSWANNIAIGFFDIKPNHGSGNKAVIEYGIGSIDSKTNGKHQYGSYQVKAYLVKARGLWWIDRIDAKATETYEFEPYETVVPGGRAKPFPGDIPIYPGFTMGKPDLYKIRGAKKPHSCVKSIKRLKNVSPDKVSEFYMSKLKNWKTLGPAGGGSSQSILLEKGHRRVQVSVHTTIVSGTDMPDDPRGAQLEISYWEE
jgi:hypothetical protein